MKKVLLAVMFALASILVCGLCLFYTVKVSNEAKEYVYKIQESVSNLNYDTAREGAEKLDEFWNNQHSKLSLIVHHDILEEIEESVKLIRASLEDISDDEQMDFKLETTRILSRIKNLHDIEVPSLYNII